jgi:hypothetical protein
MPRRLALPLVLALAACGDGSPAQLTDPPSPAVRFDIAYVSELTLDPNATELHSILGFMVVVNTGTAPLDLSSAQVVSVSDDSDLVDWSITRFAASTAIVPPGHAAGCLSPVAVDRILASGVVTEPGGGCSDYDQGLDFEMHFSNMAPPGTTYHGLATIQVGGAQLALPFTIHTAVANGSAGAVLDSVTRVGTAEADPYHGDDPVYHADRPGTQP